MKATSTGSHFASRRPNSEPFPPHDTQRRRIISPRLLVAFCTTFCLLFLNGCGKKSLQTTEIHAISEELVAAAQQIAGPKTQVSIHPEVSPARARNAGVATDHIRLGIQDPSQVAHIEQALVAIAKKHGLTNIALSGAEGGTEFLLMHDSQITHVVRIVPAASSESLPPAPAAPRALGKGPKLAIIVDDLGRDLEIAEKIVKLPYPLTISVIPNLPDSAKVAEAAHKRGDEVLLHLPMEAGEAAQAEPAELKVGMHRQQVDTILEENLKSVPHVAGVNNHQGSRATADPQLMVELMAALRQHGLFFIDSRTSVETVAYDTAERDGVRAAFRNAQFLDDLENTAAITVQLQKAERDAIKKGWAITIGHPHAATIEVLRRDLPQMRSKGIQLVFASDVVK